MNRTQSVIVKSTNERLCAKSIDSINGTLLGKSIANEQTAMCYSFVRSHQQYQTKVKIHFAKS